MTESMMAHTNPTQLPSTNNVELFLHVTERSFTLSFLAWTFIDRAGLLELRSASKHLERRATTFYIVFLECKRALKMREILDGGLS